MFQLRPAAGLRQICTARRHLLAAARAFAEPDPRASPQSRPPFYPPVKVSPGGTRPSLNATIDFQKASEPPSSSETKHSSPLASEDSQENGRPPVAAMLAQWRLRLKRAKGRQAGASAGAGVHAEEAVERLADSPSSEEVASSRPQADPSRENPRTTASDLGQKLVSNRVPPLELPTLLSRGRASRSVGSEEARSSTTDMLGRNEATADKIEHTVGYAAPSPGEPLTSALRKPPAIPPPDMSADVSKVSQPVFDRSTASLRKVPPLKLRSRSQLKRNLDRTEEQAEGTSRWIATHERSQDGAGLRGSGFEAAQQSGGDRDLPELRGGGESPAEDLGSGPRGAAPWGSPVGSRREGDSCIPLTEWRQISGVSEPLLVSEVSEPIHVSEPLAVESLALSVEHLSLGDHGAGPLTEWLGGPVDAPEVSTTSSESRVEGISEGGQGMEVAALDEGTLGAENGEASPLTEWLTPAREPGSVGSLEGVLVSRAAVPLTEWQTSSQGRKPMSDRDVQNGQALPSVDVLRPNLASGARPAFGVGLPTVADLGKGSASDADQQRTPEWHAMRRWRLTASVFSKVIGCWPGDRLKVWEEKLELTAPFRGNDATAWGTAQESPAIEQYLNITGNRVAHQSFQIYKEHDEVYGWLGASPDGLIESDSAGLADGSGILEVKCPVGKGPPQRAQPYKGVPYYYIPQIQGLLEIFDRQWADFYVWTVNGSVTYRVERDPDYWALLFPVLSEFWWQHVIPAKHEIREGRKDPAYLRKFQPNERHQWTERIIAESKRLSANSSLIWNDSGRVQVDPFRGAGSSAISRVRF